MPTTPLGFDLHLDHDRHLSPADRELHGILTVTAHAGAGRPAARPDRPRLAGATVGDGSESTARSRTRTASAGRAVAVDLPPVPQVRIRIRTVAPTRVLFCRQVYPTVRDLAGVPVDDRTVDHPTDSWSAERREYHLCFAVDGTDRPRGEDLLAARIDLVVDGAARTPPVAALVHWTEDLILSSQVDARVAHYTGQEEPGRLAADRLRSDSDHHADSDDPSAADGLLGRAVRLAAVAGDTRRLEELGLLVGIEGPATGQVRIRDGRHRRDQANVAISSSYPRHDGPPSVTDGDGRTCRCGRESPPGARYCERCGAELDVPGPVST
ncbi:zinc ribbon domain-containing protein [Micromonospora sp. NPDC050187]|uniref:zinc ribbon domain-containing protein n=1 Tax=Micromonospora sp. NPDC050187 TaxID=3364277 RepID=UPI003791C6EC